MTNASVYLFARRNPSGETEYKVGYTTKLVKSRLKANGGRWTLIATWRFSSGNLARKVEQEAHCYLRKKHTKHALHYGATEIFTCTREKAEKAVVKSHPSRTKIRYFSHYRYDEAGIQYKPKYIRTSVPLRVGRDILVVALSLAMGVVAHMIYL